jgi:hypothetical protein
VAARIPTFTLTPAAALSRRRFGAASLCFLQLAASGAALFFVTPDDRLIVTPMLAIAWIATIYLLTLWARDGSLPLFEAGTLCMLAITLYGVLALAGFFLMHGQWDPFSDGRLRPYAFIPSELGLFGWRYVVYAATFCATYLLVRGRAKVRSTAFILPNTASQRAIYVVFFALYACKIALKVVYDYDPDDFSYTDLGGSVARSMAKVIPYFILQIGHNVLGALFVAELGVMMLLAAQWRKRWCRYVLGAWLAYEFMDTVIKLGSRGRLVLLLVSAGVLYHRLVKPVGFRGLMIAGSLLLTAFLILGALRVVSSSEERTERSQHILTGANEFQGLFTTAFDIHKRKELGEMPEVPWQVYVSDLYFVIPSQFLPFEKIDPSLWYIDVIGQTGQGIGYMFGVMAQAALGFGWIELALRGAVLAAVLALLQRWYVRHALYFWPTLLTLFVSIWTYYSMRATTFYFEYFVLYHFVPVLCAAKFVETLLSSIHAKKVGAEASARA